MATEISKLAVILSANAGGLTAGLRGATAGLSKFQASVGVTRGMLGGLAGRIGALGAGIGLFEIVTGFIRMENHVARLDAVLASTGHTAGFTRDEIVAFSDSLEKTTKFAGDLTAGAAAVMATFTHIRGDVFKEAMISAQDLSEVMGQELQQSVVQIGKALQDPIAGMTALKRVGVSFSDSQREQIKVLQESGDMIGAQRLILKELQKEFGGAAEAGGKTFGGQLVVLKNAIGVVTDAFMGLLAPALLKTTDGIKSVIVWMQNHGAAVLKTIKILAAAGLAIVAYRTVMFTIVAVQRAIAAGQALVLALSGPAGWAKLALGAVVAVGALVAVNDAFGDISDSAKKSIAPINGAAAAVEQLKAAQEEETAATRAADAQKEIAKSIQEATAKLKEEIALFGMSGHAADIYRLQLQGATEAQVAQAAELAATLDIMEQQKKAWDAMAEAAKKWTDEIKTPMDKLQDQLHEINALEKANLLTRDEADAASRKAADDMEDAIKLKAAKKKAFDKLAEPKNVAALERRVTQGFPTDKLATPLEKVRLELVKQGKNVARTAKATEKLAKQGVGEAVKL